MRKYKYVLVSLASILMLLLTACGSRSPDEDHAELPAAPVEYPTQVQEPVVNPYITAQPPIIPRPVAQQPDFSDDAIFLVETIEATHPIFLMDSHLPENYAKIRDAFLEAASMPMSRTDFLWAIKRYSTALRDGHMNLVPWGGSALNIEWAYVDGNLYILCEDGQPTDIEVIYIGGIPVENIFALIEYYFYFENHVERQFFNSMLSRYQGLLSLAGAVPAHNVNILTNVATTLRDGDSISTVDAQFTSRVQFPLQTAPEPISYEIFDDVFYIDFRIMMCPEFYITSAFCHVHEAVLTAVEYAIANGMRNFIFDLRDNPGGSSMIGITFLNRMGAGWPQFGVYWRISDLFLLTRTDWHDWQGDRNEIYFTPPNPATATNQNDVFISVLTSTLSYSAAVELATAVKDGRLGNIIGEPSINAPSMFGAMHNFTLPVSGIPLRVSTLRIVRPDIHADQTTLWPDIIVPAQDALEVALEFFRNKELGA